MDSAKDYGPLTAAREQTRENLSDEILRLTEAAGELGEVLAGNIDAWTGNHSLGLHQLAVRVQSHVAVLASIEAKATPVEPGQTLGSDVVRVLRVVNDEDRA
jgi:hypothetical protein